MSPQDIAVLFTPDPVNPPADLKIVLADTGEQMIGTLVETPAKGVDIDTLGVDDVPDNARVDHTHQAGTIQPADDELGTFLGIRVDGKLAAMIGERMKPARYTEITAVCVHPSHRGRGYGQMLLSAISRQILSRGEISSRTSSPTITRPSHSTGGRGWKSAAVST